MLRVQDVMSTPVATVPPGRSADAAWQQMAMKGVHHLVVTDGSAVVGLLSERDVGGRRGAALRTGRTVRDLMSNQPVTVPLDTTVRRAANLMRGRSIGSLVVTDANGRLRGIVSVSDLLELLGRGLSRPVVRGKRWTLKHRGHGRRQPDGGQQTRS
jgi:CBS domain-containing protein